MGRTVQLSASVSGPQGLPKGLRVTAVGMGNATWVLGGCIGHGEPGPPHREHRAPSAGIVISSSASPSEGTSSDSCLTFSAGDSPAGLSGCLAAQGLVGTCSPLKLASPLLGAQSATPVLQAQGALGGAALLPVSFQEGRRASDTSLTQGDFPFHISTFPSRCHVALAGVPLSWMAEVPPFPSRAWVEQQCSLGRSKVPPVSWDKVTRPLVAGLRSSRDTWVPSSSSCPREGWDQGGTLHTWLPGLPPCHPGLGGPELPP